jgi:hypothetical protein
MTDNWQDFRFTDAELQSRLIRAVEEAGLLHKVEENGILLYPRGQPIEEFVNQIVESVFPTGYYRTDVADTAKAERYRRFTKRHGTTIVEEIRSGQTYFVQAHREKLFRHRSIPTHVSFAILRADLEPDKVSARLGIAPTFACRKGEPFARPYSGRRKDTPLRPSRTGWWELCSIPHLESNDIESHLTWLLDILEPVAAIIESIAGPPTAEGPRILQLLVVGPRGSTGAGSLSGSMLRRLSSLCDRLDVWLWPDDYV